MGDKKNVVLKNSLVGFISQALTMLFTFITRSLFIKYIGVGLLGLNSTFSSVLSALSLAELGFQSAIVFNLYKPLHDNAMDEINSIMNILKIIYRGIGLFFIAATILITPFLKFIVTGMNVTPEVYFYFWLQVLASVCTYFLAYKRAILYADQKEYISKTIDLFFSVFFNTVQCISLAVFKSYIGYLLLKLIQTYASNVMIHYYCATHYQYLRKTPLDKNKLRKILTDVRDIFASRIASFIYSSTDNLVISAFVSTLRVGFFVNYTIITSSLKTLANSILSPIIPILGNHLLDERDNLQREKLFFLNTFVRYLIALVIVIPTGILMDDFITWWVGKEMVLRKGVDLLLCMDFYIHLVHSATMDFINSAGLFKADKYIEITGAVCNLIISLILVHYLGIEGVLIGTVVSQLVFWVGRSLIVYRECLRLGKKSYIRYWGKNLYYILAAALIALVADTVYRQLEVSNVFVRVVLGGSIAELIVIVFAIIIFWKKEEMVELRRIVLRNGRKNR